ncbi:short-chain dehydrogenase [Massariosphaeria phaeospora]|uniref:Short-chain dehydrogenase n=1 Tax=Massariosphaeria phaeospora TaxID=100035 RepID=A0A7C8IG75_9PLEO|nr:short-chain dehydrogenase [Massariosphaeria phaeospora]
MLAMLAAQWFKSNPIPTDSYTSQTVIVTGSNVGLGKEAARHFTALGASTVILAVRSVKKGEDAKTDIERTTRTKGVVQVWQLDMASYASVLDFAARVEKELPRVDIAVLNAGIARLDFEICEQDESQITVNVVSTFLLALALLPKMKATAAQFNKRPTLTIVTSDIHNFTTFEERKAPEGKLFESLSVKEKADMESRYALSKLLEVFSVRAMTNRRPSSQIPVTINCVNPGFCHSELARNAVGVQAIMFAVMKFLFARTTEQGSRTLVHAGSQGAETHGQYLSDCKLAAVAPLVPSAEGYQVQERVWTELAAKLEAIKPGVTKNL